MTATASRRGAGLTVSNPELQELLPGVRSAYGDLLLALADSELVLGHRHSEWTGFAPSAEEDVAFSSIAQDEMGHAHLYYALITGAADESAVDSLALDRSPRQMRHLPLLHAPNGDWFFTIARHVYWDTWEQVLLNAALSATLPLLPSAAERILNEEVYHQEHAVQWLELLSSRPPQQQRLVAALTRVVAIGGSPSRRLSGLAELAGAGRLPAPSDLEKSFAGSLRLQLTGAGGWRHDDADVALRGLGGEGPWPTPPGLGQLHTDLTAMRRAHPGATW
ncbi:MAG: 1,2-phenylacetyl-CoA epoxidase subunit PaaC [Candidatus Dormibacteria bacterium]